MQALLDSVRRYLRYLGRLRDRMNQRGFPPGDPVYQAATDAFHAVHTLSVELHYLACKLGTARRSSRKSNGSVVAAAFGATPARFARSECIMSEDLANRLAGDRTSE